MKRLLGLIALLALAAPAAASAGTVTLSNTQQLKTEPGDSGPLVPFPSVIDVNGTGAKVTGVEVTLRAVGFNTHYDLDVVVVGPSGASTLLMHYTCGGQNTLGNPLTLTFADAAAGALPPTTTCTSGRFRPTNSGIAQPFFGAAGPPAPYGPSLSGLTGGPADGLWHLYAYDVGAGAGGAIAGGWTLALTTTDPQKAKKKRCKAKRKAAAAKKKGCKKKRK